MKPIVLPPKDREQQIQMAARMMRAACPGKPVRVTVEEAKPDRTPKQNRFLWGVPYKMLREATGFTAEELHEFFCGEHFGWADRRAPKTPRNPDGIVSSPVRTTTRDHNNEPNLCAAEDMVAIWRLAQAAGDKVGIYIPDPDPNYWRK